MTVSSIARAVVGNEIGKAAQRHRGFEAIGVTDDPIGHKATIAAPGHAHAVLIDPGISLQRGIKTIHYILIILATPLARDTAFKLLTITGRAARVREQDCITFRRIDLELVIPIDAILTRGPAMNAENQRIFLACLPANGLDEKTVDIPIVGALVSKALDFGKLTLLPQSIVQ